MDLPEIEPLLDDVDLILRHVSRRFPEDLVRALIKSRKPITIEGWIDTQVTSRQRRLDRAMLLNIGGRRRQLHTEWQLEMKADVPFRVFEYHCMLVLSAADATAKVGHAGKPPPVESVVVLLSGREEPWPKQGEYRTSPPGAPFAGVRFRIEPVYQRTIRQLTEQDSPLWMIFAPLAIDADERSLPKVIEALRARTTPEDFEELGVAMAVLADADKRNRGLRGVVTSLLPKELIMQSWIYKQGEEKGLEKGLGPLAHQFARRLGRPLTPEEHAVLVQRLDTVGAARVGDLVLDLAPDALAAWLAAPDAS